MYRLNDKLIVTQNYIDNIVLKSTHTHTHTHTLSENFTGDA